MSGNELQNYASNQNGWNWWPSNRDAWNRRPSNQADRQIPEQWWNGPWNDQRRDQWNQWWHQQNGDQPRHPRRQDRWDDQWNGQQQQRRQDRWDDQWNGQQQRRRQDPDQHRRRDYDQADWDRFYLTGRPLRDIIILVDPSSGKIFILVDRRLFEVQVDPRGRIRIHRDRRGRVWILVRPIRFRHQPQLRTQSSLAELARANGVEDADY